MLRVDLAATRKVPSVAAHHQNATRQCMPMKASPRSSLCVSAQPPSLFAPSRAYSVAMLVSPSTGRRFAASAPTIGNEGITAHSKRVGLVRKFTTGEASTTVASGGVLKERPCHRARQAFV